MTGGIDVRNGWLKLWYKSEDNPIFQDGILMAVFVKLLLRASKFDTVLPDGTEIKRGQAIISQRGLADSLMFGRMQIRRALVALERMGAITQKATHKPAQCPTIVTICKYRDYQDKNQDDNPVPSPVAAQYQPSSSPVAAQLKEGRKKKEEGRTNQRPPKSPKGELFTSLEGIALPPHIDTPEVRDALNQWIAWKKGYQKAGITSLVRLVTRMGTPERILAAVDHSLTGNFAGLYEPRVAPLFKNQDVDDFAARRAQRIKEFGGAS